MPNYRERMQDPMTLMGMNMLANNKQGPFAAFGQAGLMTESQLQRIETASANRTWRQKQSEIQQERNRLVADMNKSRMQHQTDTLQEKKDTRTADKAMYDERPKPVMVDGKQIGTTYAGKFTPTRETDWQNEMYKGLVTGNQFDPNKPTPGPGSGAGPGAPPNAVGDSFSYGKPPAPGNAGAATVNPGAPSAMTTPPGGPTVGPGVNPMPNIGMPGAMAPHPPKRPPPRNQAEAMQQQREQVQWKMMMGEIMKANSKGGQWVGDKLGQGAGWLMNTSVPYGQ